MAKTAVVLAGGGSRGAYQIGVWRAMRELGILFDIVTGASVGALNGALMVQGDYEQATHLWENITGKAVMKDMPDENELPSLDEKTVWRAFIKEALRQGGADISPLEKMVRSLIDEERLRASAVDFALTTVEYPSMKPLQLRKADIPQGMVADYLLASAACFPAFKTKKIEGTQYIDGGYYDNLPINTAVEMGAQSIIAVDLHSVGVTRPVKGNVDLTVIEPYWPLGPFILFEKETARRNMSLGYLDAMKAFGRLGGWLYGFTFEQCEENARQMYPYIMELLSYGQLYDSNFTNTLEKMLRHHLFRDLRRKTRRKGTITIGKAVTAMAEYCAACFEVDPVEPLTFEELHGHILEAARQRGLIAGNGEKTVPMLAEELSQLDAARVVLLFGRRLQEFACGGQSPRELPLLAPLFWKEMLAALYLLALAKRIGIHVFGEKKI